MISNFCLAKGSHMNGSVRLRRCSHQIGMLPQQGLNFVLYLSLKVVAPPLQIPQYLM